jgi:hypothetical protein
MAFDDLDETEVEGVVTELRGSIVYLSVDWSTLRELEGELATTPELPRYDDSAYVQRSDESNWNSFWLQWDTWLRSLNGFDEPRRPIGGASNPATVRSNLLSLAAR